MTDAADTRPWLGHYEIAETLIVAETENLRVLRITLAPDDIIPWHFHTTIDDRFFCLEGSIEIETRAPRARHRLIAGEECTIPPKTAHQVSNGAGTASRFLLVQGIGAYDYIPFGG